MPLRRPTWLLLAACSAPPEPAAPPAPPPAVAPAVATIPVRIALHGLPALRWAWSVQHESGLAVAGHGSGDRLELQLPPGPCSLRLECQGSVFELPLRVGEGSPQQLDWDVAPRAR